MAEIKKGILGGFSGKVGTVVGVNWRGKDIIRSLPKKSKRRPTDLQLMQQIKFKKVIDFLQPIRPVLNLYFGNRVGLKSRYNIATSYMLSNALEMVNDLPIIVLERVLISKGDLVGFLQPTIQLVGTDSFELNWEDNSGQGNAKSTDIVNLVCYCEELNSFEVFQNIESRSGLVVNIPLPTYYNGKKVNFWAFLNSQTKTIASTSIYLGEHIVV
ncbi:DUF6266 family protein [Empedobacter tilapiae]|uniref:DUF6266 family protein n=1 Tax=Empedobacter tilapiae TaxID=2491114 RepID=UPI0028D5E7C3|nr:DUF6266 family protein [Empedobacter tilapiae]